uniref:ribosomal protein S18 n=1 Tax=Geranium koreanum TaxID=345232 RepID=UPI002028D59D|nr:ribosomal protein S18 [Geranium koreanum]UED15802.1 ribosomal protein S18 [Geranium koreanum]
MDKPKRLFLKPKSTFLNVFKKLKKKKKRRFFKKKRPFRRRLRPLQKGDEIHYTNISFICQFISKQGKILLRRVNRLTLQQQGLLDRAIKQARILCLVSFHGTNPLIEKTKKDRTTKKVRSRPSRPTKTKQKRFFRESAEKKKNNFLQSRQKKNKIIE